MEVKCECGQSGFTTPQDKPLVLTICHCNRCKKESGSLYTVTAVFFPSPGSPSDVYLRENTTLRRFVRQSDSGNAVERLTCPGCDIEVAAKPPAPLPQMWLSAKVGCIVDFDWDMLKDKNMILHCWTKRAVVPLVPEGTREFEGEPSMQELVESGLFSPELLAQFAGANAQS